MRPYFLICLGLLINIQNPAWTQNVDSIQAAQWRVEGLKSMQTPDSASVWFTKSANQFKRLQLWDSYFESIYYQTVASYLAGTEGHSLIDSLNKYLLDAEHLSGKNSVGTGYMTYGLGWVYNQLQVFDSSGKAYEKCYQIRLKHYGENHPLTLKALSSIGVIYNISGDYVNAEKFLKKSAETLNRIYGAKNIEAIGADIALGYFYNSSGQYEEAITIGRQKLAYLSQNPTAFIDDLSRVYGMLAIAYNHANLNKEALKVTHQFSGFLKEYNNNNQQDWARVYNNLGRLYEIENQLDSAAIYLKEALELKLKSKQLFGAVEIANSYANLGVLLGKQNKLKDALAMFDQAEAILLKSYQPQHPEVIRILHLRATAYYRNQEYHQALIFTNKAIQGSRMDESDLADAHTTPDIIVYNSYSNLVESLKLKGIILTETYADFDQAIVHYGQAKKMVNRRLEEHSDRNEFLLDLADLRVFHEHEILARHGQKKPQTPLAIFETIEGAKSNMLRGILDEKYLVDHNPKLSSIHQKQIQIRKDLIKYRSLFEEEQLGKAPNQRAQLDRIDKIRNHGSSLDSLKLLFDLESSSKNMSTTLEQEFRRIKPLIANDELMLNYLFTDTLAFVFVLGKDEARLISLGSTTKIRNLTNTYLTQLKEQRSYNQELSNQLYQALFKGVDFQGIGKLCIIPDDFLWNLPFESLLAEPESGTLLLHRFNVSLLPSAILYKKENNIDYSNKVLAFAPIFDQEAEALLASTRLNLGPLIFTEQEIHSISSFFNVKSFVRKLANEYNFKQEGQPYSVVHLASHAIMNVQNPGLSYIQLYPDSVSGEDGRLYTYELIDHSFNAQLMVLSACKTGLGQFVKGDGVWGLSGAILQGGTENLIVSLDEINDQATATIIAFFYENLYSGLPLGESLRQAKIQYLTSTDDRGQNPYYWSNLVLIGNADAVFAPSFVQKYKLWILLGLFVMAITLWIVFKVRK